MGSISGLKKLLPARFDDPEFLHHSSALARKAGRPIGPESPAARIANGAMAMVRGMVQGSVDGGDLAV